MKRIALLLVMLSLLVAVPIQAQDDPLPNHYTDGTVSFRYPADWVAVEREGYPVAATSTQAIDALGVSDPAPGDIVIRIGAMPYSPDLLPPDLQPTTLTNTLFLASFQEANASTLTTTPAGNPAAWARIDLGASVAYSMLIVQPTGRLVIGEMVANAADDDTLVNTGLAILDTVERDDADYLTLPPPEFSFTRGDIRTLTQFIQSEDGRLAVRHPAGWMAAEFGSDAVTTWLSLDISNADGSFALGRLGLIDLTAYGSRLGVVAGVPVTSDDLLRFYALAAAFSWDTYAEGVAPSYSQVLTQRYDGRDYRYFTMTDNDFEQLVMVTPVDSEHVLLITLDLSREGGHTLSEIVPTLLAVLSTLQINP